MCILSLSVDQSVHTLVPVFEAVEASAFYICGVRVVPVAWSRRADIYFDLGGGCARDLNDLLGKLESLPAVTSSTHAPPPV